MSDLCYLGKKLESYGLIKRCNHLFYSLIVQSTSSVCPPVDTLLHAWILLHELILPVIHKVVYVGIFVLLKFEKKDDTIFSHFNSKRKLRKMFFICKLFPIYLNYKLYKNCKFCQLCVLRENSIGISNTVYIYARHDIAHCNYF